MIGDLNISGGIAPASSIIETGSRTPALQHFWPCTETNGSVLTDVAGGLKWDLAGSGFNLGFNSSLKTINCSMLESSIPVRFKSGAFKLYDVTKQHLFMAVCRPNALARIALGDNNSLLYTGKGSGFGLAEVHAAVGDVATGWSQAYQRTGGGISVDGIGRDILVYAYHIPNVSVTYNFLNLATNTSIWTGTFPVTDVATPAINCTFNPCMRFAGVDLYGMALYQFSAQPSDLSLGMLTMANNWKNGIRTSYAPWINLR